MSFPSVFFVCCVFNYFHWNRVAPQRPPLLSLLTSPSTLLHRPLLSALQPLRVARLRPLPSATPPPPRSVLPLSHAASATRPIRTKLHPAPLRLLFSPQPSCLFARFVSLVPLRFLSFAVGSSVVAVIRGKGLTPRRHLKRLEWPVMPHMLQLGPRGRGFDTHPSG